MAYYGVFLDLREQRCLVVGGGGIALRKIEGLLPSGAKVSVVAREAETGVRSLFAQGLIELHVRSWRPADLNGMALAIAATSDGSSNRAIATEAGRRGIFVNVVDAPELCTFIAPAIVRRGDLQIAVSTGGTAPVLSGVVRDEIAERLGPEYASVTRVLGRVREVLREGGSDFEARRETLANLARSALAQHVREGDVAAIDRLLSRALGSDASLARLGIELP